MGQNEDNNNTDKDEEEEDNNDNKEEEEDKVNKDKGLLTIWCIIAWPYGSHGLSAWKAWRMKSSRPKGPQAWSRGPTDP